MPNSIKYSTTGDTLSIRGGYNSYFWFGVGDVGKGPSSATTYYNSVIPTTGGYTVYRFNTNETSKISYNSPSNDNELITYTNKVSGQNFTGSTQCLVWYATQSNYTCVNKDYPAIVTSGLSRCWDAGYTPSYPRSGVTWGDIAFGYTGNLVNGPTYSSENEGIITYDGVDDYSNNSLDNVSQYTLELWTRCLSSTTLGTYLYFLGFAYFGVGFKSDGSLGFAVNDGSGNFYGIGPSVVSSLNIVGYWRQLVFVMNTNTFANNKIYVDGVLQTLSGFTGTASNINFNGGALLMSYTGIFGTYKMNQQVAIFRSYNRELSQSEITNNYNVQKSRFLPNYNIDAQAFINAAGITNTTQQQAINQLVLDLKAYSLWDKMKAIYPFVGGTATSHKYNLKDPRDLDVAYRIQFNGGWTHSSNGIQGDGSTGYADTFAAMNTVAIPNRLNHWSCYITELPSGTKYNGIFQTSGGLAGFGGTWGTNQSWFASLQNFSQSGILSQIGFVNGTVTSSSASALYTNGTSIWTPNDPVSMTNQANYYLGAANQNGSPSFINRTRIAFASLGGALTPTNAANFYTAVQAFQTTLGRQV
jgi:hypothetical protein